MIEAIGDRSRPEAVRAMLVDHVREGQSPRFSRRAGVALVLVGVIGGVGVSAGAMAATDGLWGYMYPEDPVNDPASGSKAAVPAPPGVIPGAPIISLLGEPEVVVITAATTLSLDDRPADATHARITLAAEAPGAIAFGTDPNGNNPSAMWTAGDLASGSATTTMDIPLDVGPGALYFAPEGELTAIASVQFVTYVATQLGVNSRGETFGVESGPSGSPDLVAVVGLDPAGESIEGYARRADLYSEDPLHHREPTSPAEALEWQEAREAQFPDGWPIPIFDSDGVTEVGTFQIGG